MFMPTMLAILASLGLNCLLIGVNMITAKVTGTDPAALLLRRLMSSGPAAATQAMMKTPALWVLAAAILLSQFCYPMILMVLMATQQVLPALNPIRVFRAIFASSVVEYVSLCVFSIVNMVGMVLLINVVPLVLDLREMTAWEAVLLGVWTMALAVYFVAVYGWRLGIFIYRNPEAFDQDE